MRAAESALGIDIGTSKVAIIVTTSTGVVQHVAAARTEANLPSDHGSAEQDVGKIFRTVEKLILAIPPKVKEGIRSIGITGQMHGVLLWSSSSQGVSPLITWEDARCLGEDFLLKLREKTQDMRISSGYGNATLSWFAKNEPTLLERFDRASTIHDYLACRLCGLSDAYSDYTDAASWGFFRIRKCEWDWTKIDKAGIPRSYLPKLLPTGSKLGNLSEEYTIKYGLNSEIPVMVPCGDNQASLLATLSDSKKEIALTLGTGGQISAVICDLEGVEYMPMTLEIRPYFGGEYLAVGASLCGGSALDLVVQAIIKLYNDLETVPPDRETIFEKIDQLGSHCLQTSLVATTSFRGERHDPFLRGSLNGMSEDTMTLGDLAAACALGTLGNLKSMLPERILSTRERIVGSGNGLRKLGLLRAAVDQLFGLPLIFNEAREEAALGAAQASFKLVGK